MGNNSTRESRGRESPSSQGDRRHGLGSRTNSPADRHTPPVYGSRAAGRGSRPDLSVFGIGTGLNTSNIPERRETKQEKEARRLERERQARVEERERSIREEHVDGGYLVTMGVYTGIEDFNKAIVRQLMIERRIAPFWRGLNDFKEEWTEHQLVAAARGLPIPAADEIPQEESTRPISPESPHTSDPNLQNLTAPISSRSQSASSEASAALSPSHPAFSDPSSPSPSASTTQSSPLRPRTKILASLTTPSKGPPSMDMVPREIQLPKEPSVNGQAMEAFLYKDATECPICFLYYPPYLNKTRCCDQPICSECFVQIKRPDPHPPEHEHPDPSRSGAPSPEPPAESEALVSEPACCPYCQQPEFGVTYEPPPFRRGLAYPSPNNGLEVLSPAMSSSSSLNTPGSPPTLSPGPHKRRTTSLSANASTVITTDRVRPDWATKLANARSHLARRSAAATALHTAAYLMGNPSGDNRSFGFASRSRFGRNRGENSPGPSGSATPSHNPQEPASQAVTEQASPARREGHGGTRRRNRMDDLEEMMMMEAIRLSLAAEEERKKKSEKEAAKEAKKRAKAEKKKEKMEKKGVYGSGASSASGSALSLSLPGLGRRRGNSTASSLAREVTPENAEIPGSKGKAVDRGVVGAPATSAPIDFARAGSSTVQHGITGARQLDRGAPANTQESHQPLSSPTAPDRPSHLRQMSNASSPASSFNESIPSSLRNDPHPRGSSSTLDTQNSPNGNTVGNRSSVHEGGDSNGSAGSEPMFNFQSLAAMIGNEDGDKADATKHIEHGESGETPVMGAQEENSTSGLEDSTATLRVDGSNTMRIVPPDVGADRQTTMPWTPQSTAAPELVITPGTPAAMSHREEDAKQLGARGNAESTREIEQ